MEEESGMSQEISVFQAGKDAGVEDIPNKDNKGVQKKIEELYLDAELLNINLELDESKKKIKELEQHVSEVQLKCKNSDEQLGELSVKLLMLETTSKISEDEKQILSEQLHEYKEKLLQIESELKEKLSRNSELENELVNSKGIFVRAVELEGLVQTSHAKMEELEHRSSELEILLKQNVCKIQELEELVGTKEAELKNKNEELYLLRSDISQLRAEVEELQNRISELRMDLEVFQARAESFEHKLQVANEKERRLIEHLVIVSCDKVVGEEESGQFKNKLKDAENQLEILHNDLKSTLEKLKIAENEANIAEAKRTKITTQLLSAEEKLEHQERLVEQTTARNMELKIIADESQTKLKETIVNLNSLKSEAESLRNNIKILQEQLKSSELNITEGAGKYASLTQELGHSLDKVHSLERLNKELQKEISGAEDKIMRSHFENDILLVTNLELQNQVSELRIEVEVLHAKAESFENKLQAACENERCFTEQLNTMSKDKITLEEVSNQFRNKLKNAESKLDVLQNELKCTHEKLESSEKETNRAKTRVAEVTESLRNAEEKLKVQESLVEQIAARNMELEALTKEIELFRAKAENLEHELQVGYEKEKHFIEQFNIMLNDKIVWKEESNKFHNKLRHAEKRVEVLQNELKIMHVKLENVESGMKIAEARKCDATESLRIAEEQLEQKERLVEQVAARNLELESLIEESQKKLEETTLNLDFQTSEAGVFRAEINVLQGQIRSSEQKVAEGAREYASLTQELDHCSQKMLSLGRLREEFQKEMDEQLCSSRNSIESLKTQLTSEREELNNQVSFISEEKKVLQQSHEDAKIELQNLKAQLDGQIKEHDQIEDFLRNEIDRLKNEIVDKSMLEVRIKELENVLLTEQARLSHEISSISDEKKVLQQSHEDTKIELQNLKAQLDGQIKEHGQIEDFLRNEIDRLKNEIIDKSMLEVRIKELENVLLTEQARLTQELEKGKDAATAREAELSSQLEDHANTMAERDSLHEQVVELQKELDLAKSVNATQNHEAESLGEEIKVLRKQVKSSVQKLADEADKYACLNEELIHSSQKVHSLEILNVELQRVIADAEDHAAQSLSANEILLENNAKLQTVAEDLQTKAESLELALQAAYEKERSSREQLDLLSIDKTALEGESSQFKDKLKVAEDQLETLTAEFQIKIEETISKLNSPNSEAASLHEEIKVLQEQIKSSEQKMAEGAGKYASLSHELDHNFLKVQSLERLNEELQKYVSDAENRAALSASENKMLLASNLELQNKQSDLQQCLESAISQKEAITRELTSHANTITELTATSELHSAADARALETEIKLQDAVDRLVQKNTEVLELNEKVSMIESQRRFFEEQAHENLRASESRRIEVDETQAKLKDMEGIVENVGEASKKFASESSRLAETNSMITQELSLLELEAGVLREKLSAALSGNEEMVKQLQSSRMSMEGLKNQLTSEREDANNQLHLVTEENKILKRTYEETKNELQNMKSQLDKQIKEQKQIANSFGDEIHLLKNEIVDKSILEVRVKELENAMAREEARLSQEVEKIKAAAIVREAELSAKLEDKANELMERDALREQVTKLQKELDLAKSVNAKQEAYTKDYVQEVEAKAKQINLLEEQVGKLVKKSRVGDEKLKEKLRRNMLCF